MGVNHLISLQENMPTYGAGGSKVTGHVTITSPGMVRCYVQNLRKPEGNANYVFCLVSKTKDKAVKLGQLGDQKEARWLVNQNNINGSGIKLEDIDAVALVIDYKDKGTENVLLGFVSERYQVYRMIDELFPSMFEIDKLTPVSTTPQKVKKEEIAKQVQEVVDSVKIKVKEEVKKEIKQDVKQDVKVEIDQKINNELQQELNSIAKAQQDDGYETKEVDIKVKDKDIKMEDQIDSEEIIEVIDEIKEKFSDNIKSKMQAEIDAQYENKIAKDVEINEAAEIDEKMVSEDIKVKDKCKFILPRDAKVGAFEDKSNQVDEDGIDEELRRIINVISQDKRVEQKAKELEQQILMLRKMSTQSRNDEKNSNTEKVKDNKDEYRAHKDLQNLDINNDSNIAQSRQGKDNKNEDSEYQDGEYEESKLEKDKKDIMGYVGQKLNIKEAEEEDPKLDMSNTTPQDALSYMNNPITIPQENTPEENSIDEAEQEYEYLRKIDAKLQQIRDRMGEQLKEFENGSIN